MAAALGVNERLLFTAVFALGAGLAGLAGALQLPREPATLGMDLATIADAFVVTVVGGLGSIPGAFIAALLISLLKSLCIGLGTVDVGGVAIAFPEAHAGRRVRADGDRAGARSRRACSGARRRSRRRPRSPSFVARYPRSGAVPSLVGALLASLRWRALPLVVDDYALVLATDVLVFALFTASLRLLLGPGRHDLLRPRLLLRAWRVRRGAGGQAWRADGGRTRARRPRSRSRARSLFGWLCVRLSGVYMAMLTLELRPDHVVDRDAVGRRHRRLERHRRRVARGMARQRARRISGVC